MSQKKVKEERSMIKQLLSQMEENEYLLELATGFFLDEEEQEEWFCNACFIKNLVPEIPDEILMPNILPFYMVDNNLIKFEDIDDYLPTMMAEETIRRMKQEYLENSDHI